LQDRLKRLAEGKGAKKERHKERCAVDPAYAAKHRAKRAEAARCRRAALAVEAIRARIWGSGALIDV
jgi:hypothetical protein